jgi:uncharacterized protein (DUF433 family)
MSPKSNSVAGPAAGGNKTRSREATAAAGAAGEGRIACHPAVLDGEAHIRGTGVTVRKVVDCLATHRSAQRLWLEFPELDPDDVRAAVDYAALQLGGSASGQS